MRYLTALILSMLCLVSVAYAQKTTVGQEDLGLCMMTRFSGALTGTKIATAIASTGSATLPDCSGSKTLVITPGTWNISSNLTIPSRMRLHITAGATLSVATGVTLTLQQFPYCDIPDNCISTTGTGTVVYSLTYPDRSHGPMSAIEYVEGLDTTGATRTDVIINAALARVGVLGGGTVVLPRGDLLILSSILIPDNTKLMGSVHGTWVIMDPSMTVPGIVNSLFDGASGTPLPQYNITISELAIDGGRLTPEGALSSYANVWNPNTTYTANQYVMNTGGTSYKIYKADGNCTSGAGTGPATTGTNISDGTCSWDFVERLWTNAAGSATPSDPILNTDPILLDGVNGFRIDHVTIKKARNDGIILQLCSRGSITRSLFTDVNKNAIYASNNERINTHDNDFSYNYGDVAYANVWYSSITENRADNTIYYFVSTGRDSQWLTVTDNVGGSGGRYIGLNESITGTAHGKTYAEPYDAYRYGTYHSVISHNIFQRMQIINSSLNTYSHNEIRLAGAELGGFPVWFSGASQNLFQSNLVYSGTTWGVYVSTLADASTGTEEGDILSVQNRFKDNRIAAPFDPSDLLGFNIAAESSNTQLSGNIVTLAPDKTLYTQHYKIDSVSTATFRNNFVGVTEVRLLQTAALVDAKGTFEATGTGFASDPTVTITYRITEDLLVYMNIPQIQGTSDANGFTITGMPAAIQPARTGWFVVRAEDNDVDIFGLLLFTASSNVLALYPSAASAGGTSLWTTSGTKTLFATQISYPLF